VGFVVNQEHRILRTGVMNVDVNLEGEKEIDSRRKPER
jgi:hypothetical protein